MNDSLDRLYQQVVAAKTADPAVSRTAKVRCTFENPEKACPQ